MRRKLKVKSVRVQMEEEYQDGCVVTMNDDSETELDQDLCDFIASDDHLSDNDDDTPALPDSEVEEAAITESSCAMYAQWNQDADHANNGPQFASCAKPPVWKRSLGIQQAAGRPSDSHAS